ncbi:MAG: hypothetical protein HQK78_12045, partial [Desulfobacterales bacterium]|nr:hypothetical protein [Desulfobacterales bacterium]
RRLSVAAVIDGNYAYEQDKWGNKSKKYVQRTTSEMEQFRKTVQNAMGYSSDREDQVSVESFPFHYMEELVMAKPAFNWLVFAKENRNSLANILLILLVFFFLVRPVAKTIKEIKTPTPPPAALAPPEEKAMIAPPPEETIELPPPHKMTTKDKATMLAKRDVERAASMLRSWING